MVDYVRYNGYGFGAAASNGCGGYNVGPSSPSNVWHGSGPQGPVNSTAPSFGDTHSPDQFPQSHPDHQLRVPEHHRGRASGHGRQRYEHHGQEAYSQSLAWPQPRAAYGDQAHNWQSGNRDHSPERHGAQGRGGGFRANSDMGGCSGSWHALSRRLLASGQALLPNGVEIRTVPSPAFPTIASALAAPRVGTNDRVGADLRAVPTLVIRVLPGVYHERLRIAAPVVLVGADGGVPTIRCRAPQGLVIAGATATSCVLRKLRLCAEQGGHAVSVHEASPLIESCVILGAGGEPNPRSPAGLDVRGVVSKPVVRGCLVAGHAGAGVCFGAGATGMLYSCDISRCGCGLWLEDGGDPVVWRNTISCHRGAGIVVRADGLGRILENTVLRNGASGVFVESSRRAVTTIAQNRVWSNTVCDLRQSPAPAGRCASDVGTLLVNNIVGQTANNTLAGVELITAWPKRTVLTASELMNAVREAPTDRIVLIEIGRSIDLEEQLVLDRPVVLVGGASSEDLPVELRGAPGSEGVVLVTDGGEAAALSRLHVSLRGFRHQALSTCVDVAAGRPTFIDCVFDASGWSTNRPHSMPQTQQQHSVLTHAVRVRGGGVTALFGACALRDASGVGLLLDHGASASMLHCEISGHMRGGVFLGGGATVAVEGCEIRRNGHFGVVVGADAQGVYIGRTLFSANVAGSIWHCGGGLDGSPSTGSGSSHRIASQKPCLLDQCEFVGSAGSPTVVVGPGVDVLLWDVTFTQLGDDAGDASAAKEPPGRCAVRAEAATKVVIAGDTSGATWPASFEPESGAQGDGIIWLDFSGALPKLSKAQMDAYEEMAGFPKHQRLAHWSSEFGMQRTASGNVLPLHYGAARRPTTGWPAAAALPQSHAHRRPRTQSSGSDQGFPQAGRSGYGQSMPASRASDGRKLRESALQTQQQALAPQGAAQHRGEWGAKAESPASSTDKRAHGRHEGGPGAGSSSPGTAWTSSDGDVIGQEHSRDDMRPQDSEDMEDSSPAEPGAQDTAPQDEDDKHIKWLVNKMEAEKSATSTGPVSAATAPGGPWGEQNRRLLFEILAMLSTKEKLLKDVLETAGLGGQLRAGDKVFLRGHTGRWLGARGSEIVCNKADRAEAANFIIESKTSALRHNSKASFRIESALATEPTPSAKAQRLGVVQNTFEVRSVVRDQGNVREADMQFVLQLEFQHTLMSGMLVYMKSVSTGRMVDVQGETVSARTQDRGTLQRIVIEKLPLEADVPRPCPDLELTLEQKSWVFRRAVQHALADRGELARYLGGHKPGCKEMLQSYTKLWESEWREEWSHVLHDGSPSDARDPSASPRSNRSRASSVGSERVAKKSGRARSNTKEWIAGMLSGVSADDKSNGDMFVSALRSFFATALRVSQMEADPVMRVVEGFAEALCADKGFMDCLEPSMLPMKERKVYKQPDEVIFGLTYTTMMLNTDLHNRNVATKTFDEKKFVGAGKDCGVTGGLMMQIFKNVKKEEL